MPGLSNEEGDHIMVCVSGGKDSATLLHLLTLMQEKLHIHFRLTAVHVKQEQRGYKKYHSSGPVVTGLTKIDYLLLWLILSLSTRTRV